MAFLDSLFGKKVGPGVAAAAAGAIIDPKRLNMSKTHSIIGSIESLSHSAKTTDLVAWLKANEFKIAKTALDDDSNMSHHVIAVRPACKGGCFAQGPGCFGALKPTDDLYVLGDTHGDHESLIAILDTILDAAKHRGVDEPTVYLLGDILDRNTESCMVESAFILAIMQRALPEQFAQYNKIKLGVIKGDHDIAMSYQEPYSPSKRFTSAVKPADYCDWLNARLAKNGGKEDYTLIGRAWLKLMGECPAGAYLEGSGTLLSHGGLPRGDLQQMMLDGVPYILQSQGAAVDFEWCRMVDAKNKLINRSSKTSEIGYQEFEAFNQLLGGHVKNFIFAHQHPTKGFMRLDKNYPGYDIICISSFRNDTVAGGPTIPYFCKISTDTVNVYSMCPAKYVVRIEESTTTAKPAAPAAKPATPVATPGKQWVSPTWQSTTTTTTQAKA